MTVVVICKLFWHKYGTLCSQLWGKNLQMGKMQWYIASEMVSKIVFMEGMPFCIYLPFCIFRFSLMQPN